MALKATATKTAIAPPRPGTAKKPVAVVNKPAMNKSASVANVEPKKSMFSFGAKPEPKVAVVAKVEPKANPFSFGAKKPTPVASKIATASKATVAKPAAKFGAAGKTIAKVDEKKESKPAGFSLGGLFGQKPATPPKVGGKK